MQISVIIPLLNEEESLPELSQWISKVMQENNFSWEVIFVDDGSRDKSWQVVQQLHADNASFKGIKFRRNYGKSAALNEGFAMAQGDVVITMDADLQDSPDEIPGLYKMIADEGFDMVSGWKKKRHDPIGKTIPSKFFNWTTARITGIKLHDFNCGLKAYKRDVVKSIEVYGEMHRYIPQIAKTAGFYKIGEKVVEHRARKYGYSKFGWERFMKGFLDLTSIMFVSKFGKKPMHLFGTFGFLSFFTGGIITIWLIIDKIIKMNTGEKFRQVTDQPLFYIALVAMIVGVQLFVGGFLGELISRNSPDRNQYQIDQRIGGV
ncbi:MAG TPA: glycosyltransferase family 2 protein [Chitinophagales bacterium]|nr:glycosyltransferase family 2 protein [Chitinophagales bacterium]HMU70413.1 glycosyltransferase family 2 protein [Chitinophagales bacterium]HMX03057.1 glycosyltransferase family 2 protein [Chitinophagales bacterium]HMZ88540.1 glycosyltransferase family 2 protein [Chitinophagales bacterium]HNA59004.1 glycosyltransferase family 2 protein [Chitinophagales bacterium]